MTVDKGTETPSTTSPNMFQGPTGGEVSENEAWNMLKNLFMDSFQESVLKQALSAGKIGFKYNVDICINWLLDQQTKTTTPVSAVVTRPSTTASNAVQRTLPLTTTATDSVRKGETVNIATMNDSDLQKAIQMSLREQGPVGLGGQISAEEQELSKIIEASIAANKTRDLRQSTLFFTDPPNPHERERQSVLPVGLKNVGNTCWFSVVVQALFHLPSFRHCIFDINLTNVLPSAESQAASSSQTVLAKELEFIFELRRLFALLLASKRKYVDPSNVVEVLRKQESLQLRNGGVDNQQDVSEFTHLVFEWIEEAFNIVCKNKKEQKEKDQNANTSNVVQEVELDPCPNLNPIQQLFYGSFLIESRCAGGSSVKEDRFSQYPLQVTDFDNLHDSFEASMGQIEFDETSRTTTTVEHWLTAAPPIFLFELSRFRYNQSDNKPEKIHSKFVFPQTLYMDRYLVKNKTIVRQKRNKVRHLRHNLKLLQAQLNKYEEYGCDSAKIPLANVLKYALKFATASNSETEEIGDVNMDSPRTSREELNKTSEMTTAMDVGASSVAGTMEVEESAKSTCTMSDDNFVAELTFNVEEPRPKNITEEELGTLQSCLSRWSKEVNDQVDELKRKINEIQEAINSVYDEPSLKKCTYVLHGVLVHEGQATLGHYWTFVADHKTQTWKKFNDVQVTEVDWNELERDCYGGYQNTSAYCLIYVDSDSVDLINGTSFLTNVDTLLDHLPADLRSYVAQDNATFLAEIISWDQRHQAAAAAAVAHATNQAQRATTPGGGALPHQQADKASPGSTNAILSEQLVENYELSKRYGLSVADKYVAMRNYGDSSDLTLILKSEIDALHLQWEQFVCSKNLIMDPRLNGVANYAVAWLNQSRADRIVSLILLELLLHVANDEKLRAEVQKLLPSYALTEVETASYNDIHRDFQIFSRTILLVTFTIDYFHTKQQYTHALQHILIAEDYNNRLLGIHKTNVSRALELNLVAAYKRAVTVKCSAELFDKFVGSRNDEDVNKCLQTFHTLVLPTVNCMAREGGDSAAVAKDISDLWISLVNNQNRVKFGVEVEKKLHDLAEALNAIGNLKLSNPGIVAKFKVTNDLPQRYTKAMKMVGESGVLTSL